jgi:hypothetical protein
MKTYHLRKTIKVICHRSTLLPPDEFDLATITATGRV